MSSVFNSQGKYDDAARTTELAVAVNPNAWQGYFEIFQGDAREKVFIRGPCRSQAGLRRWLPEESEPFIF